MFERIQKNARREIKLKLFVIKTFNLYSHLAFGSTWSVLLSNLGGGDSNGLNRPKYHRDGKVIDCTCKGLYFLFRREDGRTNIHFSIKYTKNIAL